jgi:hypothetical protein
MRPQRPAHPSRLDCVGTWLSLVEHSLGVRGVGSSNLPVPTNLTYSFCFSSSFFQSSASVFQFPNCDVIVTLSNAATALRLASVRRTIGCIELRRIGPLKREMGL